LIPKTGTLLKREFPFFSAPRLSAALPPPVRERICFADNH
jgi:hypothetical protein